MTLPAIPIQNLLDADSFRKLTIIHNDRPQVRIEATADLPSRFGHFRVVAFSNDRDGQEHAAFVRGNLEGAENVPVRVTFRMFDRRCDRLAKV